MNVISDLLITALYTVFVQNLVMSFGLGISEAIRVSSRPGAFGKFAVMISGFSVVTSVLCRTIDEFSDVALMGSAGRAAAYGGVLAAVYILTAVLARLVFKASPEFMGILGIAALNTLVLAVPFINNTAAYSFADCIGSGLGAGAAFVFAAALISRGAGALAKNEAVPEVFKGTPIMFIYVGLLSLAFAGFADITLFA